MGPPTSCKLDFLLRFKAVTLNFERNFVQVLTEEAVASFCILERVFEGWSCLLMTASAMNLSIRIQFIYIIALDHHEERSNCDWKNTCICVSRGENAVALPRA
jgi:hypothetical protein